MSTPAFNPTDQEFTTVRLYTELDPYIYSVDNRPLQDLLDNDTVLATAVDSARTNLITRDIADSALSAAIVGGSTHLLGLNASNPSTGVLQLSPGLLFIEASTSASIPEQILKKAASPYSSLVDVPHPVVLGKEIKYLVQVRHREYDSTTEFPGYNRENPFSASTMINGWLEIGIVAGAQADIGASVVPTPTTGWLPVYEVKAVAGDTTVTVTPAASAVARTQKILSSDITPEAFESSKATNGYQKLPYGLILQWGTASIAPAGGTTTFPVAFPNGTLSVTATANAGSGIVSVTTGAITSTSVALRHDSAGTETIMWSAIGH